MEQKPEELTVINTWENMRAELYEEFLSLGILEERHVTRVRNWTFRAYPTKEQRELLNRTFGCNRQFWNILVEKLHNFLESKNFVSGELPSGWKKAIPTASEIKARFLYMKEADSLSFANTRLNFMKAVKRYVDKFSKLKNPQYRKKAKRRVKNGGEPLTFRDLKGMPKFHAKFYSKDSYTTNAQQSGENFTIHLEPSDNKRYSLLRLPKVDGLVKIRLHRQIPPNARIKRATLAREHVDVYEASVTFEIDEILVSPKTDEESVQKLQTFLAEHAEELCLGLDYAQDKGCYPSDKSLLRDCSGGFRHRFHKLETKIAAMQRHLAKKQKPDHAHGKTGSKGYQKLQNRISKRQWHLANAREDDLHKLSRKWADAFFCVAVKDINLVVMMQALNLAKNLQDNGFGTLREMLSYKLSENGRFFVKVGRFFPSTQICHDCGFQYRIIAGVEHLREKGWDCPNCGEHHHRDHNAALNIRDEGIRSIVPPKTKKPTFAQTFCKRGKRLVS